MKVTTMNNPILRQSLRERRKSMIFWGIGVFAYALLVGLLYPSIEGIEGFAQISEEMPEGLQALLGEIGDITSPTGYLGAELYGFTLPLLLSILGIGYGANALTKEERSGTVELLLASPVSRRSIVRQKALAVFLTIFSAGFAVWLGIAVSTLLVDFEVSLMRVGTATLAATLVAVAFGLISFMISALRGQKGLAIGITTVLFVVSYFANTLAPLVEALQPLQNISLLHYYDAQSILAYGLDYWQASVSVIIGLLAYAISVTGYNKRDIGV